MPRVARSDADTRPARGRQPLPTPPGGRLPSGSRAYGTTPATSPARAGRPDAVRDQHRPTPAPPDTGAVRYRRHPPEAPRARPDAPDSA